MKVCKDCKIEKPFSAFSKHKENKGGLRHECRKCDLKRNQRWDKANPGADTTALIIRKFGGNSKELRELAKDLLEAQDELCAICGCEGRLTLDHCHDTGRLRGWLCSGCNTGIGLLKEDIQIMSNAMHYIVSHCNTNEDK